MIEKLKSPVALYLFSFLALPGLLYGARFGNFALHNEITSRVFFLSFALHAIVGVIILGVALYLELKKASIIALFSISTLLLWFPITLLNKVFGFMSVDRTVGVAATPYLSKAYDSVLVYPHLYFLPDSKALQQFPFQSHVLLLISLLVLIIIGLVLIKKIRVTNPATLILKIIVLVSVLMQSLFHTGLLSPYSTNYFYTRAIDLANRWYTVFLLPGQQGATGADYFVFRGLSDIFLEPIISDAMPNSMKIQRPMLSYLLSTFSFYFNPFYVLICTNLILIIILLLSSYRFTLTVFNEKFSILGALLIGSSPIALLYFGANSSYLGGVVLTFLLYYLNFRKLPESRKRNGYYLFTLGVSLASSLTYDLLPVFASLLFFNLIRRERSLILGTFAVLGVMTPFVYSKYYVILGGTENPGLSRYRNEALEFVKDNISDPIILIGKLASSFPSYLPVITSVFGLVLTSLMIMGVLFIFIDRSRSDEARLIVTSILTNLCFYSIFKASSSELSLYPRIFFHIAPIALLTSLFSVAQTAKWINARIINSSSRKILVASLITLLCVQTLWYSNKDLFGFPETYLRIQFGGGDESGIDWRKSNLGWLDYPTFKKS